jgi:hypothetical protein
MVKKSAIEKLHDNKNLPKVVILEGKAAEKWGKGEMLIPAPIEVDEIMKSVSKGKLITATEIRAILSDKHKASITCPLTTGIFVNIAAHAAEEERNNNNKEITPYWRTLKTKGELNPKYPKGIENQIALLKKEGFEIIQKGRKNIKYFVKDYDKYINVSQKEV